MKLRLRRTNQQNNSHKVSKVERIMCSAIPHMYSMVEKYIVSIREICIIPRIIRKRIVQTYLRYFYGMPFFLHFEEIAYNPYQYGTCTDTLKIQ